MSLSRGQREYGAAEARAKAFSLANPPGTPVRFWPGVRTGEGRVSAIRSSAWALLGGQAIVCVDGYAGGISLDHVEVIESAGQEPWRQVSPGFDTTREAYENIPGSSDLEHDR